MVIILTKKVIKMIGRKWCILNIKAVQLVFFPNIFNYKKGSVCIHICMYIYVHVSGYRVYMCMLNRTKTVFMV